MSKAKVKVHGTTMLICDCEGTAPIDLEALKNVFTEQNIEPATALCAKQSHIFEQLIQETDDAIVVACTHKTSFFTNVADKYDNVPEINFTNIREKASWSAQATSAGPKIAALLVEASLVPQDTPFVTMESDGSVLVFGKDQVAVDTVKQLSEQLDITLILEPGAQVLLPVIFDFPIFSGTPNKLSGHLGDFDVSLGGLVECDPASRMEATFSKEPQDGSAQCSLILDLRGTTALVSAAEKRDGYFNPDPASPIAIHQALNKLSSMVGEFEKPLYVTYNANICAHVSNGIIGCTKCLDICPTGAITDGPNNVVFDPYICAGCGSCSAVCPTGAVTYNLSVNSHMLRRLLMLSSTFGQAGGGKAPSDRPSLLVHDLNYGEEMIATIARQGDGLPASVIPFAVNEVTQFGLEPAFAAIAYGFSSIVCLVNPVKHAEHQGLSDTINLVNHILGGLGYGDDQISLLDAADPDQVSNTLYNLPVYNPLEPASFEPVGDKSSLLRMALSHLHKHAPAPQDILPLPDGAPFGGLNFNVESCTLCLSCVGACPVNALRDNPDMPQLRFLESACIQCGLCKATCPEGVIKLEPRLDFTNSALNLKTIKEEEPFDCVKCGQPFGSKSMIENMSAKLEGHSMFSEPIALERLKMCDNCRVISLSEDEEHPLFAGFRPKPRTTDDYLAGKYEEVDITDSHSAIKSEEPKAD